MSNSTSIQESYLELRNKLALKYPSLPYAHQLVLASKYDETLVAKDYPCLFCPGQCEGKVIKLRP